MAQFNFKAIGTTWQIDIYKELSVEEEKSALSLVLNRIDIFDKTYSRFRQDSLVTKMSKESGDFVLPDDGELMMNLYKDLYNRTNGLVTPIIGNLISDAGYDSEYSLRQKKELKSPENWDEIIEYKHPNLKIKKPAILDFGACGKGYLVDIVSGVLEECGIYEYCVDAGGDIFHKNKNTIDVGLENPENINQVVGICHLGNGSICGSAGNRRKWGNFTHIINPKTLMSPTEISAVWVVAENAITADALATALFFVDSKILSGHYKFEYVLVNSDKSVEKSKNFPGEIFS